MGLENVKVADVSNEMETSFRMCRIRNDNTTLVATPAATPAATSTSKHDIPVEALNLSIGQWVLVSYEGNEFPGEVTSMDDSDIEVNVMHRSANAWKWSRSEDKIFYSRDKVVCVINPPTVAGNRGQFMFNDI